ncbi:MAG TPA: magnesium transporter [Burkholderiales bacterium]|jgi:magnesium transporter
MAKARKARKPDYLKLTLAALEAEDLARANHILTDLHPADIARVLEGLSPERRETVWKGIDVGKMGEVLLELSESIRSELLAVLDDQTVVAAVRDLDTDDIADLIPELSDGLIAEILFALDKQDRQRLDTALSFGDDTAGGLMDLDVVTVRENITVEVVLRYLRRRGELPEHTDKLFVVNRADRLRGVLPLAKLLTTDAKQRVAQVMEREVIKFPAQTPDREVADAFERYNLVSAPVVDEGDRLLGRITVDDAVDVIREEADREIFQLAGLREGEDLFANVWQTVRNRWPWIAINLVTAFIASRVVGLFEGTIERLVALASLMPIVAGVGGNTGNQTITMIVRALALDRISDVNARALFAKEIGVSLLNGLVWGGLLGVMAYFLYNSVPLGLVMTAAVTLNLMLAAVAGVLIPLVRHRLGRDPAQGSSVMITAITDSGGFFIFLGLATLALL